MIIMFYDARRLDVIFDHLVGITQLKLASLRLLVVQILNVHVHLVDRVSTEMGILTHIQIVNWLQVLRMNLLKLPCFLQNF